LLKREKISDLPNKKQIKTIADSIMKGNRSAMLSTIYDEKQDEDSPVIDAKDKAMMCQLTSGKSFDA
jgi:hypothetical protein